MRQKGHPDFKKAYCREKKCFSAFSGKKLLNFTKLQSMVVEEWNFYSFTC